jgi:hypothetical protein
MRSFHPLMRTSLPLFLIIVATTGCLSHDGRSRNCELAFSFHQTDVLSASAEALDTNAIPWVLEPTYKAQLHLKLNDGGAQRFQHFNETHEGQMFDLQINGEVLATGLTARSRGAVREMGWFVASKEEAEHFADWLKKR